MIRDVAIIGMNGRFPRAKNVKEFQYILENGINCITDISQRRKLQTCLEDKNYRKAAFLEEVDKFDHTFFGISKAEADFMDPNHRMLLEIVYGTFENAGYDVDDFSGSNTGVYVSCSHSSYYHHIEDDAQTIVSGNLASMVAGRIARYFNLTGNAVLVDTACSSSLVALHMACNDILLKQVDQAIICASALNLFPSEANTGIDVGIFSPTEQVNAFAATADGTVGGEACIALLIKPLEEALANNDIIHATIKATTVNQDAKRSSFLTAPSKVAQEEVIVNAWKKAKIDPNTIEYIEAHGTGTKIGDPIEFDGLTHAFKKFTNKTHFCRISSVKTNIGHTDVAAGLAGLIKTILSLRQKKIFPSLNFSAPNPLIDFNDTALLINQEVRNWEKPKWGKRRAGVSSFGFSGTNCHVVLEEAPARPKRDKPVFDHFPLAISSTTAEGLQNQLTDIMIHLENNPKLSIKDVCYTLCVGRKHFPMRYCIPSDDTLSIVEKIKQDLLANTVGVDTNNYNYPEIFTLFPHLTGNYRVALNKLVKVYAKAASAKEEFNELSLPHAKNKKLITNFIYQYCLFRTLESFGLALHQVVGIGLGEILVDVITNKQSLQKAVEKIAAFESLSENDEIRFNEFIAAKLNTEAENSILLCLGNNDDLNSEFIQERKQDRGEFPGLIYCDGTKTSFNAILQSFYLMGNSINWKAFFSDDKGKRIELPIYNFKKTRCWFNEMVFQDPQNNLEDLVYNVEWQKEELKLNQNDFSKNNLLVFAYDENVATNLSGYLDQVNANCIKVTFGSKFAINGASDYTIRSNVSQDYKKLYDDLIKSNHQIDGIIHIGSNINIGNDLTNETIKISLDQFVFCYFHLVNTFCSYFGKGFKLSFVTHNASKVLPDEKGHALRNVASSFLRSILSDFPMMKVNAIDIDSYEDSSAAKIIIEEIISDSQIRFASYRQNHRYVPVVKKEGAISLSPVNLSSDGVYLISGGLSGLGFELARTIITKNDISELVILGKTDLSRPRDRGTKINDIERGERIDKLNVLRSLGAKVHYYAVDLGSLNEVEQAFDDIKRKIYRLDGIFHLAGLPGHRTTLGNLELDKFTETLNPKIVGTLLLHHFTWSLHPKFFVCFSSLNAIVPLKNSLDYTVANAFQDAYARFENNQLTRFYSINWPGWDNVGMSAESLYEQPLETAIDEKLKLIALEQGLNVLLGILNQKKPQVLVGDIDWSGFKVNPYFYISLNEKIDDNSSGIAEPENIPAIFEDFTNTEKIVKSIWYDVLHEDGITVSSDFFDIGGNSLNGIQVINAISRQFGVEIEFEDIFDFPTIKELSTYIDSLMDQGNETKPQPIPKLEEQQYYQVSSTQRRFWIINQFDTDNEGYNLTWACELFGDLNKEALQMAIDSLISRHEILRTAYHAIDGIPVQYIKATECVKKNYEFFDLTAEPDKSDKAEELLKNAENKVLDLKFEALVNSMLIKLEKGHFLFSITMPHICTDAWSTNIINNEIRTLYNRYSKSEISSLEPLKIQYKDYSAWHNHYLSDDRNEELRLYWMQKFLGEIPVLDFPGDFRRPRVKSYKGSLHKFKIEGEIFNRCLELSKKNEVSHFMLLLSFVKLLLFRFTDQNDIVVGTPIAGRIHYNLEDQLGCYLNTLALRTVIDVNATFVSLLKNIKTTVLEAFEHQAYPFDKLIKDLDITRDPGRMPLFDVLIGYQNSGKIADDSVAIGGIEIKAYNPKREISIFDLSFDFIESEDCFFVEIEYDTKLFLQETIELIQYRFLKIIGIILQNYNLPVREIGPMLAEEEVRDIELNQDLNLDEAF